jgi:hypothetical protein
MGQWSSCGDCSICATTKADPPSNDHLHKDSSNQTNAGLYILRIVLADWRTLNCLSIDSLAPLI